MAQLRHKAVDSRQRRTEKSQAGGLRSIHRRAIRYEASSHGPIGLVAGGCTHQYMGGIEGVILECHSV
jgi:hypothetical protein